MNITGKQIAQMIERRTSKLIERGELPEAARFVAVGQIETKVSAIMEEQRRLLKKRLELAA